LAGIPRANRYHSGFSCSRCRCRFNLHRSSDQARALKAQPSNAHASRLAGRVRLSWIQYLLRRDVLHQLVGSQKVGANGLALAEELLGLIVPVAALLVV